MKKLSLIFIFFSFIVIIKTSGQSYAKSTRFGGGISFGTGYEYHRVHTGNPGIMITGTHVFNESFLFSPAFTFFLPKKEDFYDGTRSTTLWMLDFDGHYIVHPHEQFLFYALGGINISGLKSNYRGESPDFYPDYSDQAIGLNLGGGVNMRYNESPVFFVEIKYVVGKYHQLIVTVGALMDMDWFPVK